MHWLLRQQMEQIFAGCDAESEIWLQKQMQAWRAGDAEAGKTLLQGLVPLLESISASYADLFAEEPQNTTHPSPTRAAQKWLAELQPAILATASDGVITIDAQGEIHLINPAAERMFGYPAGALVGRSVTELMPEPYRKAHEKGIQRYLQSGSSRVLGHTVELVGLHADGHLFPIELRINRMQVGEKLLFVGLLTDIATRKSAEERLKRSEATIRAIVEKAVNSIIAIDIHGIVQLFNPAAERLFGYTAAEVIGQNVAMLMPSPDREAHDRYLQNYLSSGIAHIVGKGREVHAQRRDGSLVVVDLAVSEIGIGQERQFVGMMTDLTSRKAMEQALLVARATAEQANRMKSEFLANMSHELRTPMNAIMGMTHLLLQSDPSATQQDYLRKMESAAQSLLTLITNILDFSRLEAGGVEIQALPFQLEDVLNPLLTRYHQKAMEKGLALRLTIAAEVPRGLLGDPLRLGQILNHLLNNAVKFTDRGQAGVEVELLHREKERAQLQFVVWDSGIGMDKGLQERLFQPFTQGDGSSTRRYGGTGLGLAICKPLVERMGGQLSVKSEEGAGSRFILRLDFGIQAETLFLPPTAECVLQLTPILQENGERARAEAVANALDWQALL
ncbi:PAS domain-containing hybrid sensor histidine kinase/response regulator, partial [Candidatus Magnetaquicoccus inordinatus]|uniref:PAS domain-containing hybrid sensor histidine kinase/response regulator n=1 Tax=Candidatus Magnetaquicoccus inordinatus TaxID=2496818 RepID=UPI00187D4105